MDFIFVNPNFSSISWKHFALRAAMLKCNPNIGQWIGPG